MPARPAPAFRSPALATLVVLASACATPAPSQTRTTPRPELDPPSKVEPVSRSPGAPGSAAAQTDEERKAAIDREFYGSLGEFDKRLAREQVEIEKQREAAGGGSGGNARGGTGAGDGDGDGSETAGADHRMPPELPPGETGAGDRPTVQPGGTGAGIPSGPRFPAPAGTPEGADDDIVAKQLREAAESEKDPELRARLWEEYRKYKARK